ncbi:hypothetical protein [Proteiniborus sp. MB09-C3]|uniref:hypothetical protein n=1 Tax=Proteiniborus sp. MB09-C3 TaxID=3050072 RepID=UPI0025577F95|nr:hypothetical protein [Proteiniborus sp. MB09-C3]WIV10552.1 hypothetical protein QO263_10310 [Proteiniborus sp. MB09-C3]
MEHDLTTVQGIFGYFGEHTQIFEPVRVEFERLETENTELKNKNATLEGAIMELTIALASIGGM